MSISALVAFGLLALPPGDCSGGCHPQHCLPLGGGQIAPSLGGELTESVAVEDVADGEGLLLRQPPEPAAPIVLLRPLEVAAADPQSFLASSDRPAYCTAVPFAPLSVQVQVPMSQAGSLAVEYVVLLLDGKPVERNRYSVDPQQGAMPIIGGQSFTPYVFHFPCPAPGKHILQAQYKKAGLWSRVSEPLCFDVRLPDPPQIVAMSDLGRIPVPVQGAGLISITKPEMVIRLANVSQNASVVAYLDGRPISTELSHESCCRKIRLEGHLAPGTHSLRLRTTTSSGGCSVASDPSPEVLFHYYDSDIHLLRPGRSCDNRQHSARAGCQGEGKSATESDAARAASKTRSETLPPKDASSSGDIMEESAQTSLSADRPPPWRFASTGSTAGTAFWLAACQGSDPMVEAAWDDAESKEIHAQAEDQLKAARAESSGTSGEPARVRRAALDAKDLELQADAEERLAEARIAAAEAAARIERARAVEGPPSPFHFASAAHFPVPDFGPRGEMIDRGGLTIYEDMEFRFDRNGNYEVRFRATTPAMPTTVQLQFQIQPRPGGPWYTVTLAPIEFKYPDPNAAKGQCTAAGDCSATQDQQCCGPVRECVCKGHSEILRRCYGEMGQDATIRRTGTARFGFGVDVR